MEALYSDLEDNYEDLQETYGKLKDSDSVLKDKLKRTAYSGHEGATMKVLSFTTGLRAATQLASSALPSHGPQSNRYITEAAAVYGIKTTNLDQIPHENVA